MVTINKMFISMLLVLALSSCNLTKGHTSEELLQHTTTPPATENAAFDKCVGICQRLQTNCYFDCGRTVNTKSQFAQTLWLKCTENCDHELKKCSGKEISANKEQYGNGCRSLQENQSKVSTKNDGHV